MVATPINDKAIFDVARQIESAEARAEYLRRVCGDNRALLDRIVGQIQLLEEYPEFLESPPEALVRTLESARPAEGDPTLDLAPVAERPGMMIGRYKLVREIGHGGMGIVYLAVQQDPVKRQVALKIIKPGMDTKEIVARFEAERQALAMMDHQCIAHVLDGGSTESGRPYFVMELVDGTPITNYCDQCRYTTRQRLELFIQVCQAIQHAHLKGVIHRDIKPSNILVTNDDHIAVPKVIDFGIAKALHQPLTDASVYTQVAQMIGTPMYMSPEQAQRTGVDVDTRTDVYSLGVLLYELLTGATPFDRQRIYSADVDEVRRMIREEEPPRPSTRVSTLAGEAASTISTQRGTDPIRLGHTLRGELDWIVMKGLEKDRTRRYETASDFAQDIQRYLNHQPVEAGPPSALYRFRKFVRRNRTRVITAAVVGLALLGLISLAFYREQALRRTAQQSQQRAERSELDARQMSYASDIMLAAQAWREGDLRQLTSLLAGQRPKVGQTDLRGFEWYYLWQLPRVSHFELPGHEGAVYFTCCSSDGRFVATAGEDGTVRVYDIQTRQEYTTIETGQGEVNGIAFAPDGHTLSSAGDDGTVRVWDLETGQQLRKIDAHPGEAYNVLYAQDGELLISCGDETVIRLWDPRTGESRGELTEHSRAVEALALSPDGQILASASSDSCGLLWDLETRTPIQGLHGHVGRLSSIAFSPDGQYVATGGLDKTLRIWNAATGAQVAMLRHLDSVQCLAFGPEGEWLAAGDRGGVIRLWPRTWTLP